MFLNCWVEKEKVYSFIIFFVMATLFVAGNSFNAMHHFICMSYYVYLLEIKVTNIKRLVSKTRLEIGGAGKIFPFVIEIPIWSLMAQ